jgi:hypothetical protein
VVVCRKEGERGIGGRDDRVIIVTRMIERSKQRIQYRLLDRPSYGGTRHHANSVSARRERTKILLLPDHLEARFARF